MKLNDQISGSGIDLDIVVTGFPGKSVCHGGLGWSTVVVLKAHGRIAVVDTGNFSMRLMLLKRFAERGINPKEVTDLLLTHSHHDHSVNFPMFPNARIVIGEHELNWSLTVPWGETPVPEFYMRELKNYPKLATVKEGDEVFPGITAYLAPGHTPGCVVYVLRTADKDVIFAGDAAKNRAELVSGDTDMTYDAAVSKASIAKIMELWRKRPGSIMVPGHDMPMILENGVPKFIDKREAAILAWYGDDMEQTTLFKLTV